MFWFKKKPPHKPEPPEAPGPAEAESPPAEAESPPVEAQSPPVKAESPSAGPEKPAAQEGVETQGSTQSAPAEPEVVETVVVGAGRPRSVMERMNDHLFNQVGEPVKGTTGLVNEKIIQAVQFSNSETFAYAPAQIAIAPDMMISQAAGLVAQAAAGYFDGISKIALAAQAVLLKEMTENITQNKIAEATEDALGALATDLLVGAAAAVAAAAGAMEAEAASVAIDKIDQSIAKYSTTLAGRVPPTLSE